MQVNLVINTLKEYKNKLNISVKNKGAFKAPFKKLSFYLLKTNKMSIIFENVIDVVHSKGKIKNRLKNNFKLCEYIS